MVKQKLSTYFSKNKACKLLGDILSSYSHSKLVKIFINEDIKILFGYFMEYNNESFLESYEGDLKSTYRKGLDEMMSNFV